MPKDFHNPAAPDTCETHPLPRVVPKGPLVVALAYENMALFEFSVAVEVFGLYRPEAGEGWYRFAACAFEPAPLMATGGVRIAVDGGLELMDAAHTIIIPSWLRTEDPVPTCLKDALIRAHRRGARLVSICGGVYVMGAIGLLDGRRATTHWRAVADFQSRFPKVETLPDVLYVDEGDVLSSAGSAAGIDLCLHIVRKDFGAEMANKVARRLVVPPHRDGGQAQYIDRAVAEPHEAGRLTPLLDHMRARLEETHRIEDLAARAGMSRRTFIRRFEALTGLSPARWLLQARLHEACVQLEAGRRDLDGLAAETGFGTADTLRHHFRTRLKTSPSAYRATFASRADARPPSITPPNINRKTLAIPVTTL